MTCPRSLKEESNPRPSETHSARGRGKFCVTSFLPVICNHAPGENLSSTLLLSAPNTHQPCSPGLAFLGHGVLLSAVCCLLAHPGAQSQHRPGTCGGYSPHPYLQVRHLSLLLWPRSVFPCASHPPFWPLDLRPLLPAPVSSVPGPGARGGSAGVLWAPALTPHLLSSCPAAHRSWGLGASPFPPPKPHLEPLSLFLLEWMLVSRSMGTPGSGCLLGLRALATPAFQRCPGVLCLKLCQRNWLL